MQSDVFRFVALRQAVKAAADDDVVIESSSEPQPSELARTLTAARTSEAPRTALSAAATEHIESTQFVRSLAEAAPALGELETRIIAARGDVEPDSMRASLTALDISPADLDALQRRLVDSFVAALLVASVPPSTRATLERGLRALAVLVRIVQRAGVDAKTLKRLYARPLALPRSIFPVPLNNEKAEAAAAERYDSLRQRYEARQARVNELAERLRANEAAAEELLGAYGEDSLLKQRATDLRPPVPPAPPPRSEGFFTRALSRLGLVGGGRMAEDPSRGPAGPFVPALATEVASRLSTETTQRLAALGRFDSINVPDAVTALDSDSARIAEALYRGGASGNVARIGNVFVSVTDVVGDFPVVADPGWPTRVPGLCAPADPESPNVDGPTIPEGVGKFHSLGVADLLVVRQTLLRYELGEIAHVENVMAKEARKRQHRNLNRREEFRLQETERIEESEKDLQSAERFELQSESERTIEENASRQAGVTVTASYGPSVEVTANAAFASDTAKSQSNRIASAHAREITERSVQRIQERVRELRSALIVNEIEEINEHGFDNDTDTHIVGVYRWLDKIYQAQVFDYGKREILELVVPEPAAFFRHSTANKPAEGITLPRPEPPGYCGSEQSTFEPLEPKDVTRTSYLLWAARYSARNIKPPPPRFRIIATAFDQPWVTDDPNATATSNKELKVPEGYRARRAWSAGNHAHYRSDVEDGRNPQLKIYVGRHELNAQGTAELNGENEIVPIAALGILLLVYAATVEVECELTEEAFAQWQLETYTAIMNAYEEQKAVYEQQLAAAEAEDEDETIRGRNPAQNRKIEQRELKRAAVSQMTGQQFDLFDAMRRNVGPHGFPQADLDEAFAEGEYIRFVEQAFEWENMQYLFYPYFWGRKDQWPVVSQLDDADPIFTEFLSAGAARVNVPVRPGFENAVNAFLSTGILPWKSDDGDATITPDEPFLSIAEEMKSQQGAIHTKSGGVISVDQGSSSVTGAGTDFDDDDVNREITIRGEVYRIKSVASATALTLTTEYRGADVVEVGYVIGAKAVGEPWTLRIPTDLVMLQEDRTLPELTVEE